jgi:competence protein ComEC
VLKVGHHGSNTSTSEAFIQHIKPAEAIISVGLKNRFNHPTRDTLQTLAKHQVGVHRTDQKGMIYYTWWPHQKLSPANWLLEKLAVHGRIEKETGER